MVGIFRLETWSSTPGQHSSSQTLLEGKILIYLEGDVAGRGDMDWSWVGVVMEENHTALRAHCRKDEGTPVSLQGLVSGRP